MKIKEVGENEKSIWKEQVDKSDNSKPCQNIEFIEVIKKTYKNCKEKHFISAEKDQAKFIFPLFNVKSKFFGNRLISVPFLEEGGFFGEVDFDSVKQIIERLKIKKGKFRYIEIRLTNSEKNFEKTREILKKNNFVEEISKQQFITKLSSAEEMWKKFHKHTRNDIRKAQKSDLVLKKIESPKEIKEFYKLYLREMKNFGTPQHSFKFFRNLFNIMGMKTLGLNCYKEKKLIGSLIFIHSLKKGHVIVNVSKSNYRKFRPNDLLYWEMIKFAIGRNINQINLGQVEASVAKESHAKGLYNFKKKWLGNLYNRVYFYYSFNKGGEKVQGKKDKLKKFRKIWKRLPLFVLKKIGPVLTSELGI